MFAILGLKDHQTSQKPWVPCDPLAFAAALHDKVVLKSEAVYCTVETVDKKKRGQTYFHRHGALTTTGGMVHKVDTVDADLYAEMLQNATDI